MADFNELLKKYITESKISVRKLAAECDIERTTLQKYMSGVRVPNSVEIVKTLSASLMLPPDKKSELIREYNICCYGENQYKCFSVIRDILNGMRKYQLTENNFDNIKIEALSGLENRVGSKAFYGALEVENLLMTTLLQVKEKKDFKIRILAQPDNMILTRVLLQTCRNRELHIEQIVCLDRAVSGDVDNISVVQRMLPFIFNHVHYVSYYYYDNRDAHINSMSLLPVLILADDCAIVANSRMDECIIYYDTECVLFYEHQYERIKVHTAELTCYMENLNDMISFIHQFMMEETDKVDISIGMTRCLSHCLDMDMLLNHLQLIPDQKMYIATSMNNYTERLSEQPEAIINIFSEEGLRLFMETGRINEYPDECYTPLSTEECVTILERGIEIMKQGYLEYLMVNPEYLTLDGNLLIYLNRKVVFQYSQEGSSSQGLSVDEISIRNAFREFVYFAKENCWVYSAEETLARMQEVLDEYRMKITVKLDE